MKRTHRRPCRVVTTLGRRGAMVAPRARSAITLATRGLSVVSSFMKRTMASSRLSRTVSVALADQGLSPRSRVACAATGDLLLASQIRIHTV